MRRQPWLKRKKTDPELPFEPPIRLGNMSNGEYFHESTAFEKRVRVEILRQADEKARKLGVDRREFLASAMGMATSVSVLNMATACGSGRSSDKTIVDMGASGRPPAPGYGGAAGTALSDAGSAWSDAGGPTSAMNAGASAHGGSDVGMRSDARVGSSPPSGDAGGYAIPDAATMDCELAEDILNGKGEFILDAHTHHLENEGQWRTTDPLLGDTMASVFTLFNGCQEWDPKVCVDAEAYLQKIFLESDTTLAVLSGFPSALCTAERTSGCGNTLDNDAMGRSRDRINMLAKSQRLLNHCQVNPTDNLPLQLAIMERITREHGCCGFKTYPEWGPEGRGWWMYDRNAGIPMIEKARELGKKIICAHKGVVFPNWDAAFSDPGDMGVVAKMFPDVTFIVYHSAVELDASGEGPYNPRNTLGTDRTARTFEENGLKSKNLYTELGTAWGLVMNTPDVAQHLIGKLLKYCGEDNVLWGTECVWMGSPQPQIEAFRAFQISKEFQDRYGYPELTPAIKAKIFGLNAAKVYGVDPSEIRCRIKDSALARLKRVTDGELGPRRWAFQPMGGPRTRREFLNLARLTRGRPG